MRRTLDIVFASLILILTFPLILVVAALIKLESSGPIFFRQNMVGWKGQKFQLFRFRTMFVDSSNTGFTRVGTFTRNYSLDHLPQFFNLLRGDITIIGPRPIEADVVDLRDATWQQYVQTKPGLFNYAIYKLGRQWTPSRLSHPDLNQELELEYMRQRSAASDLRLLMKSLKAFFTSKGNIKARGEVDPELEQRFKDH